MASSFDVARVLHPLHANLNHTKTDHAEYEKIIKGKQGQVRIKNNIAVKRHFNENKFQRELKILNALNTKGNVHIVKILKANILREIHMPHSGTDLYYVLQEYGAPMNCFILRNIFCQILEGLLFMKECGYSHYDIKMENILLTQNGTVKLCDFGASKTQEEVIAMINGTNIKGSTLVEGTFSYNAPEMLLDIGSLDGEKVDTWALGLLLYQCAFFKNMIDLSRVKGQSIYAMYKTYVRDNFFLSRIHRNSNQDWDDIFLDASIRPINSKLKKLLRQMLCFVPFLRFGLAQTLESDFLQGVKMKNHAMIKELFFG
jgi:serine/threonine protein kinase